MNHYKQKQFNKPFIKLHNKRDFRIVVQTCMTWLLTDSEMMMNIFSVGLPIQIKM